MVFIERITTGDILKVHEIQKAGFEKLYRKYGDKESPYNETSEDLLRKFNRPNNYMFLVKNDKESIGYIRVITTDQRDQARIAPIVILPEYENLGLGKKVMQLVEMEFNTVKEWHLETILQESKLIHFYTQMGYKQENITPIQNGMDEVSLIKFF
ncbi:GNAT family N-acetyltransferase [Enterococcus casseliflavus]|uniref:GNAT family N-acetyltransferase n=1 Tax=Enterococcus casseliflavus TaxID=37734 RepID=UPI0034D2A20C